MHWVILTNNAYRSCIGIQCRSSVSDIKDGTWLIPRGIPFEIMKGWNGNLTKK